MKRALVLLFFFTALVLCAACSREPTGYETKIHFVVDNDYLTNKNFEDLMVDNWEVINVRRATSTRFGPNERWGNEYTMRKATYD